MQSRSPQVLALVASGSSVLGIGAVLAALMEFGPHARHMAVHILVMSVGAPLLAAIGLERFPAKWIPVRVKKTRQIKNLEPRSDSIGTGRAPVRWKMAVRGESLLWVATFAQIALLWAWHLPVVQNLGAHLPGAMIASHACLLLVATTFWISLFSLSGPSRWHTIPALLLTAKLVCLLAALLVFAPRALYGSEAHAAHGLDDQHLAGLLMLAACPLSYLVAAVVMTVHLIGADEPPRAATPIQRTAS